MSWIKDKIKSWLEIEKASKNSIVITEPYDYDTNVLKNDLWYRGDESELQQFYRQLDDGIANTTFWSSTGTTGIKFRKIHSGLPKIIINTLVDNVCGSINAVHIDNENSEEETETEAESLWKDIKSDNDFDTSLSEAIKIAAVKGDGAFKISMDKDVSMYPIIEFYPAERVRFEYKRGRLDSITYLTRYTQDKKSFTLEEVYSKKGIKYQLYDDNGNEVELNEVDELADLEDVINPENFQKIMGMPLMFEKSLKWKGRGASLLDGKDSKFDAFDEVVSQWMDALRDGRTNKYIPEAMLPRDPLTGQTLSPNSFDNRYVKVGGNLQEESTNKIEVVAGKINAEELNTSYITILDLCLQGLISPSTLGIDIKKLDNAEAQREKEKTTLYTRAKLVNMLEKAIPELIGLILNIHEISTSQSFSEHKISVSFGEYANPSFEAKVETVGQAKQFGIMSIEQAVEELYGNSWTKEEKQSEVDRLKEEQGVIHMEEESMVFDLEDEDETDNGSK